MPLEVEILEVALELREDGEQVFHGYAIASRLAEANSAKKLTAYGTLYRALGRLRDRGLVESQWEDPVSAEAESRPRRRLYSGPSAGQESIEGGVECDVAVPIDVPAEVAHL